MNPENDKPLVDDELLENSGAAPEDQNLTKEDENLGAQGATISDNLGAGENAGAMVPDDVQELLQQKDDRYKRLYAEFDNYKKRNQRERLSLMETAGAATMKALLPALDDFDRAEKQAIQDEDTKKVWDSGVGLIVKKLYHALGSQGLKPMDSTGQAFDADLHEAVTEIPSPDMAGKVVDTIERGYTLNGKIIRHAKVVVGK